MATIVPASLVVASADLGTAIDKKQPELEALAAALTLELDLSAKAPDSGPPTSSDKTDQSETEREEGQEDQQERCDADGVTLPPETCFAAAEFGEAFEAAWGASLLDRSGTGVSTKTEDISAARRAWARRQVLLESIAPRTATASVAEAASSSSHRQAWTRGVMDAELKARTGSGPVTGFGKLGSEIFAKLVRIDTRSVVVEEVDRPLTLRELASPAVAAAVGWSIDGVGLGGTQPTLIDKLSSSALKETLTQWAEEKIARPEDGMKLQRAAKLAAMSAASQVRATNRVPGEPMRIDGETMRMVDAFVTQDLVQSYRNTIDRGTRLEFPKQTERPAPPRVSLETVWSKSTDWTKVENALRHYRTATGSVPVDSLASYSSVFPGIEGQRAQSQEAQVTRALDAERAKVNYGKPPEIQAGAAADGADPVTGGGRGLKTLKATEITRVARDHLDRARSFMRLRSYQRVGGVLIGRKPDAASEGLDIVGVDFPSGETRDGLTIHFTHADGARTTVGPYDPAVAHLALAYAADGRPTTVTILPAPPLPDQKILLHPALVDTHVGCHAIRLDQFVDRFGSVGLLGARRTAAIRQSQIMNGLYRRAWAARLSGWLEAVESASQKDGTTLSDDKKENIKKNLKRLKEIAQNVSEEMLLPDGILMLLNPKNSLAPFRHRPDFFDPQLLSILEECLTRTQTESGVSSAQCVALQAKQTGGNLNEELTHHWYLTPQLVPNSGVREVSYKLDKDLQFAQMPRDIWEGPLRFVVLNNIVITQHFGKEVEFISTSESEPWEIAEIQDLLEDAVLSAVRVSPQALRTLRVIQQFTVVQRLFRAAFEGSLGEQFPVERLVEITRETANHVDFKAVITDRWLLREASASNLKEPVYAAAMQLREALAVPAVQEATCLAGY